jgi:serine/threonine protein kinase
MPFSHSLFTIFPLGAILLMKRCNVKFVSLFPGQVWNFSNYITFCRLPKKNKRMKEQHGLPVNGQQLHHFSNYDLIRRIDVGGMGEVYLAHQRTAFNRKVAVKIIRSDLVHDSIARKRFLREAEVSAHLKHDHILPLVEFGEEQGRLFIVTPYIEGGTLARRLQSGPLSLAEIHQLFTALVQAISYIHRRGVIHRDLKPSNILLDQADDSDQVYVRLIDFGIASLQGNAASPQMTIGGQEMGTIAYLAPERLNGIAAASNDIYSLGVILYQMLVGNLPSETSHLSLPPALDTVVRRSTAIHPEERYQTADELLKAFEGTYRYLSSVLSVQLPVTAQSVQPGAEINDFPTPGRPLQTPRPVEAVDAPVATPAQDTPSPARQATGPQPVTPVVQRASQTTARQTASAKPVSSSRQTTTSQSAKNSSEMPALPVRQPMTPRASAVQDASSDVDVVYPEQRLVKRAGMLVHTQDQANFTRQDYDAPTSSLDPAQLTGRRTRRKNEPELAAKSMSQATSASADTFVTPVHPAAMKKRGRILLAFLPLTIILILLVVGGLTYVTFQASITANVSATPQAHSISQVFTIKAKPGQSGINQGALVIPANVMSSNKTGSLQGNTTGRTNCTLLGILGCKQAVSSFDVTMLATELKPTLQKQISQDLQKQAMSRSAQLVGTIVYNDGPITSNPEVNTESKTVTVTVVEQGNVEYFTKSDAQKLAGQLLQQQVVKKFGANYLLLNQYTQLGTASVQSIDANGVITIAIAAAGIASYQMPDSTLSTIQGHIKGQKLNAAIAYLKTLSGVDPASVSVKVSSGDTIPTNMQQIRINMLTPDVSRLLPVTLPKVNPGMTFNPATG